VVNDLVWDERDRAYESPYAAEQVALMPGVPEALRLLADHGYRLVVVSNQPGAAKRKASLDDLRAAHERVVELLAAHGVRVDSYRYCFHHPEGTEPGLSRPCSCRKPEPGLITEAAAELALDLRASWMVGDADRDVEAGRSAGCRTVIVLNPLSQHRRNDRVEADASAGDLAAAAAIITRSAG
jgi:D-glycero-D-manno-heptose 1,7-bisphosphate phosphatase